MTVTHWAAAPMPPPVTRPRYISPGVMISEMKSTPMIRAHGEALVEAVGRLQQVAVLLDLLPLPLEPGPLPARQPLVSQSTSTLPALVFLPALRQLRSRRLPVMGEREPRRELLP